MTLSDDFKALAKHLMQALMRRPAMKRTLLPLVGSLAVAAALGCMSQLQRGGAPSATCRPSDLLVEYLLPAYQRFVTSTDTTAATSRHLRQLPAVSASQVIYVTDDAVCAQAEKAYTAALGVQNPPVTPSLQVYVFKVGHVYVVWDPVQTIGHYATGMTLSNSFKVLAKYSM